MNKFEQEVDYILDYVPVSVDNAVLSISTLHDKEMIEFAEWCSRQFYSYRGAAGWVKDNKFYTTPELLTIFRNQQK